MSGGSGVAALSTLTLRTQLSKPYARAHRASTSAGIYDHVPPAPVRRSQMNRRADSIAAPILETSSRPETLEIGRIKEQNVCASAKLNLDRV